MNLILSHSVFYDPQVLTLGTTYLNGVEYDIKQPVFLKYRFCFKSNADVRPAVLTESILEALGLFFGFLTNMAFTKL